MRAPSALGLLLCTTGCGSPEYSLGDDRGPDTAVTSDSGDASAEAGDGGCAAPVPGEWHVAPTGSDSTGNGSASCPWKTIAFALSATKVAANVVLHKGTYGFSCASPPCDATPIVIAPTVPVGTRIVGQGAPADVTVRGDTAAPPAGSVASVFSVAAKGIGFANLTVRPGFAGTSLKGSFGLHYTAPASPGAEGRIENVVISSSRTTLTVPGPAAAIGWATTAGASPTIGPGVTLDGGYMSLAIFGSAAPTITGTAALPTVFKNAGALCIYVDTTSTTTAPRVHVVTDTPGVSTVTLKDCGTVAAVVVETPNATTPSTFDRLTITRTLAGDTFNGLHATIGGGISVTNSRIENLLGDGIYADSGGGAGGLGGSFDVKDTTITGGGRHGVQLRASARANIVGLTATANALDNLHCANNAKLKVRGSSLLGSLGGSGLAIRDACAADLGSGSDPGGNVFNKTGSRNALSGLCFGSDAAAAVTASSSTFSCDWSGAGCTASSFPTVSIGASCAAKVDITVSSVGKVVTTTPTCCP